MTKMAAARDSAAEADPREAMLDLIEYAIEAGLAADLGVQLEARVLRLLPALVRADAARPAPAEPATPATSLSIDERLALAGELAGLRSIRARRLTDIERAAVDAATARVHAALDLGAADSRRAKARGPGEGRDRGADVGATDSRHRSRTDDPGAGTTKSTRTGVTV